MPEFGAKRLSRVRNLQWTIDQETLASQKPIRPAPIETDERPIAERAQRFEDSVDLGVMLLRRAAQTRPSSGWHPLTSGDHWITSPSQSMLNVVDVDTGSSDWPNTAGALVSMFGSAALGAKVDASAINIVSGMNGAALSAVRDAVLDTPLRISEIRGGRDAEIDDWNFLVLRVSTGNPGSEMWLRDLDAAGRVMETATEQCPDLVPPITSQIVFDI